MEFLILPLETVCSISNRDSTFCEREERERERERNSIQDWCHDALAFLILPLEWLYQIDRLFNADLSMNVKNCHKSRVF